MKEFPYQKIGILLEKDRSFPLNKRKSVIKFAAY